MTTNELQERIKKATTFISEGKTNQAICAFEDIISQHSNFEPCYSLLCDLYLRTGRTDFPAEWIKRAVKYDPTFNETFIELAVILQTKGTKQEALRILTALLEADPNNQQARNMLDDIYRIDPQIETSRTKADFPECLLHGEYLPLSLDFDIGNRCNASCIMCDGKERWSNVPPKWRTADEVNNLFKDIKQLKLVVIDGENCEPFLNKDLFDIIRILKSKKAVVHVISNGSLINKPTAEKLIETKLNKLSISVHGATQSTADAVMQNVSFKKVISSICELRKLKEQSSSFLPKIVLVLVGMKRNITELSEFVALAGAIGVDEVYIKSLLGDQTEFVKARLKGENLVQYPELLRREYERARITAEKCNVRLDINDPYKTIIANKNPKSHSECEPTAATPVTRGKTRYCPLPFQKFHLRIDGTINPCCSNTGRFTVMGNIHEKDLASVWNSDVYIRLRRALLSGDNLPPYCDSCERAPEVEPVIMQMDIASRQAQNGNAESQTFIRENKQYLQEYIQGIKSIGNVPVSCNI